MQNLLVSLLYQAAVSDKIPCITNIQDREFFQEKFQRPTGAGQFAERKLGCDPIAMGVNKGIFRTIGKTELLYPIFSVSSEYKENAVSDDASPAGSDKDKKHERPWLPPWEVA